MRDISQFETSAGRRIYMIPVQTFPNLVTNVFVISDGQHLILVDCGSGLGESNEQLVAGLAAVGERFGETITLGDIDTILITHAHIDHYGGLPFIRQHTLAPIGIHVLDRRVISNHEERVVMAAHNLANFLRTAGVDADHIPNLMNVYLFSKQTYRSTPVQFLLEEDAPINDDIPVFHVPGHCPGQVCLLVDDIMLTADHVLSRTTPHQAPESITRHMGLSHYLDSLTKIEKVSGIRLGLGNHENPMPDVPGRIREIKAAHDDRLNKVLGLCQEPKAIVDISRELFGEVNSFHVLLALEETGAHVEYLYQRGELVAANVDEIEHGEQPVILYQRAG